MDNYEPDWIEYRHRRRDALLGYLMFPVVGGFVFFTFPWFHSFVLWFGLVISEMLFFAVTASRLSHFKCPRCGERFCMLRRGPFAFNMGPLVGECQHCGLKKFALTGEPES